MLGLIRLGVDIGFLQVVLKDMEKEGVQQTRAIVLAYWNKKKLTNYFVVCFYTTCFVQVLSLIWGTSLNGLGFNPLGKHILTSSLMTLFVTCSHAL
jgi:hypothetical protein